nr:hypothetical protein [Halarchaeum nitratireducens]
MGANICVGVATTADGDRGSRVSFRVAAVERGNDFGDRLRGCASVGVREHQPIDIIRERVKSVRHSRTFPTTRGRHRHLGVLAKGVHDTGIGVIQRDENLVGDRRREHIEIWVEALEIRFVRWHSETNRGARSRH